MAYMGICDTADREEGGEDEYSPLDCYKSEQCKKFAFVFIRAQNNNISHGMF